MFDKTKTRIETQLNDRVVAPIRTAILISCAAFVLAGLAFIFSVKAMTS